MIPTINSYARKIIIKLNNNNGFSRYNNVFILYIFYNVKYNKKLKRTNCYCC